MKHIGFCQSRSLTAVCVLYSNETLHYHHDKHHKVVSEFDLKLNALTSGVLLQTYVDTLNALASKQPELLQQSLTQLVRSLPPGKPFNM
jgi:superoxide dismutase